MTISHLAVALWMAAAPPAQESAKEFVSRVYAPYLNGGAGWFVRAKESELRRVFTPALAGAIWKQFQEAAARNEVPLLNGDPLVGAQERKISSLDMDVRPATSDIAIATVSIANIDGLRVVVLSLCLGRDGWRIAEVDFESGDRLSDIVAPHPGGRRGSARSFRGKVVLEQDPPPEWKGPSYGGMVLEGDLGLGWWQGRVRAAAFLTVNVGGGSKPQHRVIEAVEADLPPGADLSPLCWSEGIKEDRYQFVALRHPSSPCAWEGSPKYTESVKTDLLRAWKVDRMRRRLLPIPVRGLSCDMSCAQ